MIDETIFTIHCVKNDFDVTCEVQNMKKMALKNAQFSIAQQILSCKIHDF